MIERMSDNAARDTLRRVHVDVAGTVQGVGFRPFVFRLTKSTEGVEIHSQSVHRCSDQGAPRQSRVDRPFSRHVESRDRPHHARIADIAIDNLIPRLDADSFAVVSSRADGHASATLPPDLCTCGACLRELFDHMNRRYRYPFINCTACGPHFTSLVAFRMIAPSRRWRRSRCARSVRRSMMIQRIAVFTRNRTRVRYAARECRSSRATGRPFDIRSRRCGCRCRSRPFRRRCGFAIWKTRRLPSRLPRRQPRGRRTIAGSQAPRRQTVRRDGPRRPPRSCTCGAEPTNRACSGAALAPSYFSRRTRAARSLAGCAGAH